MNLILIFHAVHTYIPGHTGRGNVLVMAFTLLAYTKPLAEWFCIPPPPADIIGPNRSRGFAKAEVAPSVTCCRAPLLRLGAALAVARRDKGWTC